MTNTGFLRPSTLALVSILLASGLAGCEKKKQAPSADTGSGTNTAANEALPMPLTIGPATTPVSAPSVAALPAAPRPRIARVASAPDNYAYVDRAYAMSNAIGEAPPDYGFDYQGIHPWVWHSGNGSVRLVEPVDGGNRYYYFQSGASEPYLVSDPNYSYGYSSGQLVTVYDSEGRLLPPDLIDRRADDAGRYLARAVALYEASIQSERRSVNAANWAARRAELDAERAHWEAQQSQQEAWRAYHAEHDAEEQSYWQSERARRDQSTRAFNDWSGRNFNGPPPPAPYSGQGYSGGPPSPGDFRDGRQPSAGYAGQDARGNPPGPGYDPLGHQPPGTGPNTLPPQAAGFPSGSQRPEGDGRTGGGRAGPRPPDASLTDQGYPPRNLADATRQAQAKAAADAVAKQQQAQADAARAQQKAQADAAAKAQADDARQAQAKAANAQQPTHATVGALQLGQGRDNLDHPQPGHSQDDKKANDGRPKDQNDATPKP